MFYWWSVVRSPIRSSGKPEKDKDDDELASKLCLFALLFFISAFEVV